MALVDRVAERAAIDSLLDQARQGLSGTLVLRGEPGIGKTALLRYGADAARGLRVERVVGVEAEAGFPFAALHRLLIPFLGGLDGLPESQRRAVAVACGLEDGPAADLMLVGLGALSLLSEAAATEPLLLCVDDVQWVDRESLEVLAFLGRRIHAEGIVLLLAIREGEAIADAVADLPTAELAGLDADDAVTLLRSVVPGQLDGHVALRVAVETAGNPLALTDLALELTTEELVDRAFGQEPLPIGSRLEAHYLRIVGDLPADTRTWLLVAAAEPAGDVGYVTAASATLGLRADASTEAEVAGLVAVRRTVEFRHPLIRSAIYGGATSAERRAVHQALGAAPTRAGDGDSRAWHGAAAATGPDEQVAAALEAAATGARERGGYTATSQFLVRAAELSPAAGDRARRLLGAAQASLTAGAPHQAQALLARIDQGALDRESIGRRLRLTADLGITLGEQRSFAAAPLLCLQAAEAFGDESRERALEALLHACSQVITTDALLDVDPASIAAAIRDGGFVDDEPVVAGPILEAFATLVTDGYVAAVPALRRAIAALTGPDAADGDVLAHYVLVTSYCTITWAHEPRQQLQRRAADVARKLGALRDLDIALYCESMSETDLGNLAGADRLLIEGHQIRSALGATSEMWEIYRHPELLAWHGTGDHLEEVFQGMVDASAWLGNGATMAIARLGRTILDVARGNYQAACASAQQLIEGTRIGMEARTLPTLVEAAVRAGEDDVAEQACNDLDVRATAAGTPWALGVRARARALVSADAEAEAHYREAVDRLAATTVRSELARSHLVYGEWLRRRKRRADARQQLQIAHELFVEMGAMAFAERANAELAATGGRASTRAAARPGDLTPQEAQIARLAAAGDTNAEIAARLYISARTVDYHLRKVFRKLGVTSRRELRGLVD